MVSEQDVLTLARMAGLKLDPAHLPGVVSTMQVLLAQAALLNHPPIAAEVEPAAAYHA
ncbi:MAG: AtzG-like protein [Sphingomonadaceae bacterium]